MAILALVIAFAGALNGCSLIYNNSYQGPSFTMYSDRSPEFLQQVGQKAELIYSKFGELFGLDDSDLGRTTIIFAGEESEVIDHQHSAGILGYYIPLFNFISIDRAACWPEREDILDQVLLHEIGHHFIVTAAPAASRRYWLNEGLAGAIEVTLFADRHFEYPLFNPPLFEVARHAAVRAKLDAKEEPDALTLSVFLKKTWDDFHDTDTKEQNYALAWSLVYFILQNHLPRDLPLEDRIRTLLAMDDDEVAALESPWRLFLHEFDVTRQLLTWSADTNPIHRLRSLWAIDQLGTIGDGDDLRTLYGLSPLLQSDDVVKRRHAAVAFLKRLDRTPSVIFDEDQHVRRVLTTVRQWLTDPKVGLVTRQAVVRCLGECRLLRTYWIPHLVNLLNDTAGSMRATAASALARIAAKPTIVNPEFWEHGPTGARAVEVAEWHEWLTTWDQELVVYP